MAPARSTVRIARATPRQLDQLVPLVLGYFEFYQVPASAPAVRRFLRARLTRGDSHLFLARLNGQPVGFMQLYPTFATLALKRAWVLYDLFVAPTARRHGVATALLERAHRLGAQTGATELVLETARTNRQAQRLYEGLGWQRDNAFLVYRRYYRPRK
ncbi:MAG: GNAT family N-acetyltransferase [Verrucomicrobiota bacterium]